MLKPRHDSLELPLPGDERPVGEIVNELIDNGKAYARAEMALYTTMATTKAKGLAVPAALLFTALLVAQAGITALAVAIVIWLVPVIGPILSGILALAIFCAAAAGLAWFGVNRAREVL
jgi:hypothetical protein